MNLRNYQHGAVSAIQECAGTYKSLLVVMPTGTGKTVVIAEAARVVSKRTMVIAHRTELITQAAAKIERVTGEKPEIEKSSQFADTHMFNRAKVVVASVQTLNAKRAGKKRYERFDPKDFDRLIIDECHHSLAASYRAIIDYFRAGNPNLVVVGVTATADRGDGAGLKGVFDHVAYKYEILDAIKDGWLVRPLQRSINVQGLSFANIQTTAGDLNGRQLAEVMENEKILHQIVLATLHEAQDKKCIVFSPPGFKKVEGGADNFRVSERIQEIFERERPGCSRLVTQDTDDDVRLQIIRDYAAHKFQFLINVGVFTEGFDEPTIDMVVVARPTKSRALFAQMVGRGTRPLDGVVDRHDTAEERTQAIAHSLKPHCTVLIFNGDNGQHKLVSCADVLGGSHYSDKARARASKKADQADEAIDVLKAMDDAVSAIDEEEKEAVARDRFRRRKVRGQVDYTVAECDPFDVFDLAPPRKNTSWSGFKPATPRQIEHLRRQGVPIPAEGMSMGDAGRLISELKGRGQDGRATFLQAKMLRRYGYPTDVSYQEAKSMIEAIKASGVRAPAAGVVA